MTLDLAVVEAGQDRPGPPLVILHGLFGAKKNWGALQKQFARTRSVIAADLRNHGQSPWDAAMDYTIMAQDVARLIETRCAGGPVHLLGHSMGGKAAMMLALSRPELLASLIVVDIAPAPSQSAQLTHYAELLRDLDLSPYSRRSEVDAALKPAVPDDGVRAFLLTNLETAGDALSWKPNLDALVDNMPQIEDWPALDGVEPFEGPTLFIAGGRSDYIGPQHQAEIERLFPNAEIETIPGAGHWVHAEAPKAFLETVERFLAE
ncbi:MAG: alpha/beta fold hydrolase [Marivibrio sp.]|uniref:alpha/beta fold hydrolase n=1 Tax=Marivibrio sp. TaxID=2039719 RepID=UPI0032EC5348